jgi:hypothetical protein
VDRRRFLSLAGGVAGVGVVGSVTDALPVYRRSRPSASGLDPEAVHTVSDFEVSTEKAAPCHRWVLTVTDRHARSDRASIDGEVADAADLDPEVAAFLRAAATDDDGMTRRTGRDALPDGLRRALARYEAFAGLSETDSFLGFSLWRRHPDREPALRFDAELRDARVAVGNPGRIALSVTNRSDERQTMFTGPDPPFGHQWAERTDTDGDETVVLWQPDSPFAHLNPLSGGVALVAIDHPVAPNEVQTQRYELRAGDLSLTPGEYEATGEMHYRPSDESRGAPATWGAPYSRVEWRVGFEVE